MAIKYHLLKPTVVCFFVFIVSMLVGSSDALSTTKGWKYTITNHTGYDIIVTHKNCVGSEWDGGYNNSPCVNFKDVRISSKTSVSRNQSASSGGKRNGTLNVLIDVYEKGTTNLLFSYTTDSLAASWMALYNSWYVRAATGNDPRLRIIWMRASGESFLNVYSSDYTGTDWMASIDGNKTLAQIAMPGTHDSGAFNSSWICECQSNDPTQQLDMGVRSFDFRVVCYDNRLYLVHGNVWEFGCTFDFEHVVSTYLDSFRKFLDEHSSETIMIHVKEESDPLYCDAGTTGLALKALLEQEEAKGLQIMKSYDAFPTLGDAKGKVLIFHEPSVDGCCDYPIRLNWTSETPGEEVLWGSSGSKFFIEDAYNETSGHKWSIVLPLLVKASQNTNSQMLYYVYTSAVAATNPAAQAADVNEWLATWLSRNPDKTPYGALIADYITCAEFSGVVLTQYCDEGGYDLLPFMIYSTNF